MPHGESPTRGTRHEGQKPRGGVGEARMRTARCRKLWPSSHWCVPARQGESGSGSDDHDLGGGGFRGSCLTPLERVVTLSRPGGVSLFFKGAIR